MLNKSNSKAFTLIELLIVISIIGILAGVTLSIIDPKRQQNVASDSVMKSNISKVAEAVEAYVSAENAYPATLADASVYLYMGNVPTSVTYKVVSTSAGPFYVCGKSAVTTTIYFVYSSGVGKMFECSSNCVATYGCQ